MKIKLAPQSPAPFQVIYRPQVKRVTFNSFELEASRIPTKLRDQVTVHNSLFCNPCRCKNLRKGDLLTVNGLLFSSKPIPIKYIDPITRREILYLPVQVYTSPSYSQWVLRAVNG